MLLPATLALPLLAVEASKLLKVMLLISWASKLLVLLRLELLLLFGPVLVLNGSLAARIDLSVPEGSALPAVSALTESDGVLGLT